MTLAGVSEREEVDEVAGPAHVATVSFLASRVVPTGGFVVALAGGTALARVAQRRGLREGYGASIAAMLETVAIMGPSRFSVPLTQALGAPLLGRMEARGYGAAAQFALALTIRMVSNAIAAAFFIWVIAGGLDAYAGSYDNVLGVVNVKPGRGGTLALSFAGLMFWGLLASAVQTYVYRRGLARWGADAPAAGTRTAVATDHRGRFDPRAAALAAALGFGLLLASTQWLLLGASAAALAIAWLCARGDNAGVRTGVALAALLGGGALVFSLVGGLGVAVAARRALRAVLLVAVATWLRSAAGPDGLREVGRRALHALRAIPSAREAARVLEAIGAERELFGAGRALRDRIDASTAELKALVDAVLDWVVLEAGRFEAALAARRPELSVGAIDAALLVVMAAPAVALFAA